MWIPFELGQTVYIVVDNGYNTEHTIHDGYDHLGEIVRRETVHHPLLEVEPRRFNLQMLAYCGLDNIYATREEAETHLTDNGNVPVANCQIIQRRGLPGGPWRPSFFVAG